MSYRSNRKKLRRKQYGPSLPCGE